MTFTTKDIDKLRKNLKETGAIPLKPNDMIEMDVRDYKTLMKLDKWAKDTLHQAGLKT